MMVIISFYLIVFLLKNLLFKYGEKFIFYSARKNDEKKLPERLWNFSSIPNYVILDGL